LACAFAYLQTAIEVREGVLNWWTVSWGIGFQLPFKSTELIQVVGQAWVVKGGGRFRFNVCDLRPFQTEAESLAEN